MEKYYDVDRSALQNFKGCHDRVRDGKVHFIFWERTREGYLAFLAEIGTKPCDGQKWSVGRIDHSLGYQPGNIQWELHKFNSVKRRGTRHQFDQSKEVELKRPKFKKGSAEWFAHQRDASLKRWSDPSQRENARRAMIGNRRRACV